jgi:hypothetical protein
MGQIGFVLSGLVLVSSPALAQTAQLNAPIDRAVAFQEGASSANLALPYIASNQDRRLADGLPGAWEGDRQALSAVQSARNLDSGDAGDGVMLYATSRRTIVSWSVGAGIDDASVSRMELTPGQASVGVAYRSGNATVALAYMNQEYSQRVGAQSVSQTENYAGVTMKLQLGQ